MMARKGWSGMDGCVHSAGRNLACSGSSSSSSSSVWVKPKGGHELSRSCLSDEKGKPL